MESVRLVIQMSTNNTGIFTNLASGLYVGVITDDNGCKASVNVNINQASELSLAETHTDVVCNDGQWYK
jgi:hypothetical protein